MLVDQGFSGHAIVSYDFTRRLSYDLVPIEGKGSTYMTVAGDVTTSHQIMVHNMKLPHLTNHRTFSATLQVMPEMVKNFGYVLGMKLMKDVGLDTSVQQQNIVWGEELTSLMVPGNYWTEVRDIFATSKKAPAGLQAADYSKPDLTEIMTMK